MAKPTLLEIVQDILSDMTSDEVNSISDTVESEQVANIVRSTFNAMMSNRNWPHTARTITLVPSGDSNFPTHMTISDEIKELISVYYDKRRINDTKVAILPVLWKEPDDFLRLINGRNSTDTTTINVIDPTGVRLLIANNKSPDYFTSFDDTTLVFDSFDSDVDSTLQASKTMARAFTFPTFEMTDAYIPDLPMEAFAALIEEAKSKASFKLRQVVDQKSEQEATRQQNWLARKDWRIKGGVNYPNFGRNRGLYGAGDRSRDPTFRYNR